jgi:hypothetical protein
VRNFEFSDASAAPLFNQQPTPSRLALLRLGMDGQLRFFEHPVNLPREQKYEGSALRRGKSRSFQLPETEPNPTTGSSEPALLGSVRRHNAD